MDAYLAARAGDAVGAHASALVSLAKVAMAVGAGVAVGAAIVALASPVGWVAVAGTAAVAVGTGASVTAIAAKLLKRADHATVSESREACLHPHLIGLPCSLLLSSGSPDTVIEGKNAARAALDFAFHGAGAIIAQGSATVLVNGRPLARENDAVMCGGRILHGCDRTWIGGRSSVFGQARSDEAMDWLTMWAHRVAVGAFVGGAVISLLPLLAGGSALAAVGYGAMQAGLFLGGSALLQVAHTKVARAFGEDAADLVDMGIAVAGGFIGARRWSRASAPGETALARPTEPGLDEFVYADGKVRLTGRATVTSEGGRRVLTLDVDAMDGEAAPGFLRTFGEGAIATAEDMGADTVRVRAPDGTVRELALTPNGPAEASAGPRLLASGEQPQAPGSALALRPIGSSSGSPPPTVSPAQTAAQAIGPAVAAGQAVGPAVGAAHAVGPTLDAGQVGAYGKVKINIVKNTQVAEPPLSPNASDAPPCPTCSGGVREVGRPSDLSGTPDRASHASTATDVQTTGDGSSPKRTRVRMWRAGEHDPFEKLPGVVGYPQGDGPPGVEGGFGGQQIASRRLDIRGRLSKWEGLVDGVQEKGLAALLDPPDQSGFNIREFQGGFAEIDPEVGETIVITRALATETNAMLGHIEANAARSEPPKLEPWGQSYTLADASGERVGSIDYVRGGDGTWAVNLVRSLPAGSRRTIRIDRLGNPFVPDGQHGPVIDALAAMKSAADDAIEELDATRARARAVKERQEVLARMYQRELSHAERIESYNNTSANPRCATCTASFVREGGLPKNYAALQSLSHAEAVARVNEFMRRRGAKGSASPVKIVLTGEFSASDVAGNSSSNPSETNFPFPGDGWSYVLVHGTPRHFLPTTKLGFSVPTLPMGPESLAREVIRQGYRGGPLRLDSCSSGQTPGGPRHTWKKGERVRLPDGLVQRFTDALHRGLAEIPGSEEVAVIAPSQIKGTKTLYDAKKRPRGRWRAFFPQDDPRPPETWSSRLRGLLGGRRGPSADAPRAGLEPVQGARGTIAVGAPARGEAAPELAPVPRTSDIATLTNADQPADGVYINCPTCAAPGPPDGGPDASGAIDNRGVFSKLLGRLWSREPPPTPGRVRFVSRQSAEVQPTRGRVTFLGPPKPEGAPEVQPTRGRVTFLPRESKGTPAMRSEPDWFEQVNSSDCGPGLIYNYTKIAGIELPQRDVPSIRMEVNRLRALRGQEPLALEEPKDLSGELDPAVSRAAWFGPDDLNDYLENHAGLRNNKWEQFTATASGQIDHVRDALRTPWRLVHITAGHHFRGIVPSTPGQYLLLDSFTKGPQVIDEEAFFELLRNETEIRFGNISIMR